MAPGPLTLAHAQLLVVAQGGNKDPHGIDPENRCAACHAGNEPFTATAIAKQSTLCLKCHMQEMPNAVYGSPHDLQSEALAELVANGDRPNTKSFLARLVSRSPIKWQENQTECSQCHREHQGSKHDLQNMTTARCQACHRDAFQSFSIDHPEFKDYPYQGGTNIAFDHIKHRDLHFTKKGASFDCKACHVQGDQVGVVGQVFRSVSFEQACASCHLEPVKSALQDGLIVLQVPSVNIEGMAKAREEFGSWPTQASQLTDGVIPPVMRLLIESEPGGLALLDQLPASGRLAELDTNTEKDRDTLVKLSMMTKQLMQKMANEGQPGFRTSVETLLKTSGVNIDTDPPAKLASRKLWLDSFSSGIPPDLFRAAYNEWFDEKELRTKIVQSPTRGASTLREASSNRTQDDDLLSGGGKSLLNPADDDLLNTHTTDLLNARGNSKQMSTGFKDSRAWDQLAFGGWMIDRQRMSVVYVPSGHADPWLSKWIELEEMRDGSSLLTDSQGQQQKIALAQQCRQCHSLHSPSSQQPVPKQNWSVSFRNANQGRQDLLLSDSGSNECWKAKRRAANLRPITRFDHGPHLTLPKLNDCQSCHQLGKLDFIPMQKDQCSSCHQANAAGESCTQCHNYHVGTKAWAGQYE